jgi:dihydroorotase
VLRSDGCGNIIRGLCSYGADFYQLPRNTQQITLEKTDWQVPDDYPIADKTRLTPLKAGEILHDLGEDLYLELE